MSVTRVIGEGDVYDPEIVLFLRGVQGDENGKAHFLYMHKDGSADYTTYDAAVLNRGVRWMVNHKDWKSMGMVLPATAEPEGYLAEKEKGNVRILPGKETFRADVTVGCLAPEDARRIKHKIETVMK